MNMVHARQRLDERVKIRQMWLSSKVPPVTVQSPGQWVQELCQPRPDRLLDSAGARQRSDSNFGGDLHTNVNRTHHGDAGCRGAMGFEEVLHGLNQLQTRQRLR